MRERYAPTVLIFRITYVITSSLGFISTSFVGIMFDNFYLRRTIFCHPVALNSDILWWIAHLLIRHWELSKLCLYASLCQKTAPKKGSPCAQWRYNLAILRSVARGRSVSWSIVNRCAVGDDNSALPCYRSCTVKQREFWQWISSLHRAFRKITSTINQQMHLYNFHLEHFNRLKTTPTYFDLFRSSW